MNVIDPNMTMGYNPQQENYGNGNSAQFVVNVFDGTGQPYTVDLRSFQKQVVTFGRERDNDIVLNSGFVSRHHGYFRLEGNSCTINDQNSSNGTYLNGGRITSSVLQDGDRIQIDKFPQTEQNGVLFIFSTRKESVIWQSITLSDKQQITIGRSSGCDVVLDHQSVSKLHAYIQNYGGKFLLIDNNSLNGVYVNGKRLRGSCYLQDKDVIVITNSKLLYSEGILNYCVYKNGIGLEAVDIVKRVRSGRKDKVICNHVSLTISPCSFTGIIGGSGAGKTTFMNCLCGYNKATEGQVLINGVDLYANYDSFKSIIGYVPQQDIIHGNLPLREMLEYAAKLRMPPDSTKEERSARVSEAIRTVELDATKEP